MEDYTNKYKGEQVEIALFGGEYQDGVLTAYCYLEDVAHVELNGHILIPLQNIASLHCSSRCDAPEPDWPPRGLAEDDGSEESYPDDPRAAARPQRAQVVGSAIRSFGGAGNRAAAHRHLPPALDLPCLRAAAPR